MALIKEKYRNSIWYNLLAMIIIAIVFYMLFFAALGRITGHGEEVKMPVLVDRNVRDAVKLLEAQGFEIDIDSSFEMKKQPGIVLSQLPDTGQFVKKGRTVFIVINKTQAPPTEMPNLAGVSYRTAEIVLKSNKLRLGDTIHRPDIANGAILEALYQGKVVNAGDMLPQGSKITLVIGDGLGNVEFDVPDVVGMTYPEAIAVLNASGLQFIDVWEGRITDSQTAVIYAQFPEARNESGAINTIKEGQLIDIKVSQTAPVLMQASPQNTSTGNKKPEKPVQNRNQSDNNGDW